MMHAGSRGIVLLGVLTLVAATLCAQEQPAPARPAGPEAPGAPLAPPTAATPATPAATQPTSVPAEGAITPIKARVIEVRGDVKHAPVDSEDWQPVQVDEEYPEQTVILTGLRSSAKLQIGADDTYTLVVVEPVTKTLLTEAYTTADSKHVNIGVGYGQIRAGVAEGGLKSEFTVASPVATLSKRGTWNFGLFYERGTGRFEIFLLDYGLVEALHKGTGQRREILPGQAVTQAMRRWADESQVRRNVAINDFLGQADIFVAFNRLQQDGLRVLNPEGGQTVLIDLSSAGAQQQFTDIARQALPNVTVTPQTLRPSAGRQARPEGFFGTGRGDQLISVIIDKNSPLAQRGFAKPGTYNFQRSAIEGWLSQQGGRK
jgi:hypothetical protein